MSTLSEILYDEIREFHLNWGYTEWSENQRFFELEHRLMFQQIMVEYIEGSKSLNSNADYESGLAVFVSMITSEH